MLVSAHMDDIDNILLRVPELRRQGVSRVEIDRSEEHIRMVIEILPSEHPVELARDAPQRHASRSIDDPATYGAAVTSPYANLMKMRGGGATAQEPSDDDDREHDDPNMRDHL